MTARRPVSSPVYLKSTHPSQRTLGHKIHDAKMNPSWQSWRRKKITSTPSVSNRVKSADRFRRAKQFDLSLKNLDEAIELAGAGGGGFDGDGGGLWEGGGGGDLDGGGGGLGEGGVLKGEEEGGGPVTFANAEMGSLLLRKIAVLLEQQNFLGAKSVCEEVGGERTGGA